MLPRFLERSLARSLARFSAGFVAAASLLAFAAAGGAEPPEPPGAFTLLREVQQAHAAPAVYSDSGRLVAASGRRARFATLRDASGAFRFEITWEEGPRQVLWGGKEGWFRFDEGAGAWWPVASPLAELAELARGGGLEALLVPAWASGGAEALPPPDGAAIEGPEACGETAGETCWRLVLAWPGLECHLLVETASRRVRQVETRALVGGLDAAFADAGLEPDGPGAPIEAAAGTTRVWHREAASPPASITATFTPPVGSRAAKGPPEPARQPSPQAAFGETLEVALTTIPVRALDPGGDPIPGLGPADFAVRVGRRPVPVQAVDFYSAVPEHRPLEPLAAAPATGAPQSGTPGSAAPVLQPPPRLVVLFVQADMHALRVRGHLKMLPFVERLLAELPPRDRVAVVSFDSHLKLWQDFTLDRERVQGAVWDGIRFGGRPAVRGAEGVSLARRWDQAAARDAAHPERALELVADGLAALPGEKVIVFLGWGLGRFGADGFKLRPDYRPAVAALGRARATVFVLDVADAAFHSLEIGLRQVAADTGGTYAKTAEFPASAVRRLVATLGSWYVLSVAAADLPEDCGALRVELVGSAGGRRGQVLVGPAALPCYNPSP